MTNLSVVETQDKVVSINHSPMITALGQTMKGLMRLSDMVAAHLLQDMQNTEALLTTNPRVKELHDSAYDAIHNMSEKFRGIKLVCTRLGLTFPKDFKQSHKTQLVYFAERLATLKDCSVQFSKDTGVMSISLLIEKEEDGLQYYSVDAVDAASGTILFPTEDYINVDVFNKLNGISEELYVIATQYSEAQRHAV